MVSFTELSALLPGWQLIIFFIVAFLFLAIGCMIAFRILYLRTWPIRVMIIHRNVRSQGSHIAGWDRAKLIGFLRTGEEIYYWRKKKKYRIGNEEYVCATPKMMAWARGRDGYYRNIGFADVDKELRRMGLVPIGMEMRMATGLVDQGLEQRHDARTFLEKWMVPITIGMLILSILANGGMFVWQEKERNKGKASEAQLAQTNKETMQLAKEVLNSIANLRAGGTGLLPA